MLSRRDKRRVKEDFSEKDSFCLGLKGIAGIYQLEKQHYRRSFKAKGTVLTQVRGHKTSIVTGL